MTLNIPGKIKAMSVEDYFIVTPKPCCVSWTVAMDRESLLPAEGFWVRSLTTNRKIIKKENRGTDQFWASFDIV